MSADRLRNATLHAAGVALLVRTSRQNQEYTDPRPFPSSDVSRTVDYAHSVVRRYERLGVDLEGKRVLELGPGRDLSTGAVMLHRGAASYQAIDAFDNRAPAPEELFAAVDARYGTTLDPARIRFSLVTFPDLHEVTEQFDVIVSHATLEHVPAIPDVFRALRRVAAPGAVFAHLVDGMTHTAGLRERDPLNILRTSDAVYGKVASFAGAPNRLRSGDFVDAASAAGFHDAHVQPEYDAPARYLERVRPSLDPRFRDRDDLKHLSFSVVARG